METVRDSLILLELFYLISLPHHTLEQRLHDLHAGKWKVGERFEDESIAFIQSLSGQKTNQVSPSSFALTISSS